MCLKINLIYVDFGNSKFMSYVIVWIAQFPCQANTKKDCIKTIQSLNWCEWRDLNPYVMQHTPLKRACLPIPAHSHFISFCCSSRTMTIILHCKSFVKTFLQIFKFFYRTTYSQIHRSAYRFICLVCRYKVHGHAHWYRQDGWSYSDWQVPLSCVQTSLQFLHWQREV